MKKTTEMKEESCWDIRTGGKLHGVRSMVGRMTQSEKEVKQGKEETGKEKTIESARRSERGETGKRVRNEEEMMAERER